MAVNWYKIADVVRCLVKTKQTKKVMKKWILCGCAIPILSLALKDHRRHCSPSRLWVFGNTEDMNRKQQASPRGSQLDSGTHSLIVTHGSISSELRDLREISVLDLSFPAITVKQQEYVLLHRSQWPGVAHWERLVGGRDLINEWYRFFPNV